METSNINRAPKGQIGGDHYQALKIQPLDFWLANSLPAAQGEVIKQVTRYREKGGELDLRKAIDYLRKMVYAYFDAETKCTPATWSPDFIWAITPSEYCWTNKLDYCQSFVIMATCVFRKASELESAIGIIGAIIAKEYPAKVDMATDSDKTVIGLLRHDAPIETITNEFSAQQIQSVINDAFMNSNSLNSTRDNLAREICRLRHMIEHKNQALAVAIDFLHIAEVKNSEAVQTVQEKLKFFRAEFDKRP